MQRYALALAAALLLPMGSMAQTQPAGAPEFQVTLADKALLAKVQKGGYVLYMRHGYTDNSKPDLPNLRFSDCHTQRPLTDEGRQLAANIGQFIRQARIPVSEVFASPLCRARESAEAAFGNRITINDSLMYTANLTSEEKKPVIATTRRLLSEQLPAGRNRVVVAHAPNMFDLIGYFVKPEGTVVILKPLGNDQFEYVASIPPEHWPRLLR